MLGDGPPASHHPSISTAVVILAVDQYVVLGTKAHRLVEQEGFVTVVVRFHVDSLRALRLQPTNPL